MRKVIRVSSLATSCVALFLASTSPTQAGEKHENPYTPENAAILTVASCDADGNMLITNFNLLAVPNTTQDLTDQARFSAYLSTSLKLQEAWQRRSPSISLKSLAEEYKTARGNPEIMQTRLQRPGFALTDPLASKENYVEVRALERSKEDITSVTRDNANPQAITWVIPAGLASPVDKENIGSMPCPAELPAGLLRNVQGTYEIFVNSKGLAI